MHKIVVEIALLIMKNHGIVFLNFCGNLALFNLVSVVFLKAHNV